MPSPYQIRLFPPSMVFPAAGYLFSDFFLIFLYLFYYLSCPRPKIGVPGCRGMPKTCLVCYNVALLSCPVLFQKVCWAKLIPFAEGAHTAMGGQVLSILSINKLYLKPEKCQLKKQQIEFLGLIVSEGKVEMDPIKVSGIRKWPIPNNKKELWQFLGFWKIPKGLQRNCKPITQLTGNNTWKWETEQQMAFDMLKETITTAPCLCIPEHEGQFRVEADASEGAVGAVVSQQIEDKWHLVAFYSKALSPTERNYEIYDKEMLAIMEVLAEYY